MIDDRGDRSLWVRFLLAILATWRLTHLFAKEDGPANLVVRFRARLGSGSAGRLMDCFNCLSVWVAAPVPLLQVRTRVLNEEWEDVFRRWYPDFRQQQSMKAAA